jgi:NAD(P)H-hydrate epimerase
MSGAAYMSSQSALYGGAGLVTVGICESISSAMEAKTTEAMTLVLDDCDGHIAYTAEPEILKQLEKCDTVLIGPGLGRSREAARIVKTVLTESKVPVIVDADALYAVAQNIGMLRECSCPLIFTPHEMEMARLINEDVEYVRSHRIEVSREFCEKYGVTLILKGSRTLITAPDLTQYINITGNPGMATGGSGDVLAGLTAALTARISDETKAAAAAVYLHGIAGDLAAKKYGMDGMTAVDIMECLRHP